MSLFHVTARSVRSPSLCDFPIAPVLWRALRRAFPDALSAGLMPDHSHVQTPGDSADEVRLRMAAVLSGVSRSRDGTGIRWLPVDVPPEVPNAKHAERTDRYIALNPSRDGLVADPLEWSWSTHRDVCGAVVDPWVTPERLAAALGRPARDFAQRRHAYVSGDPTVNVSGTPFPTAAEPSPIALVPLVDVVAAVLAAYRAHPDDARRRGIVRDTILALGREAGWNSAATLARIGGLAANAVSHNARRGIQVPDAVWLCLGDPRLLAPYRGVISLQTCETHVSRQMGRSSALNREFATFGAR